MIASDINPVELKVFLNHIYEFKKEYVRWYSILPIGSMKILL